MEGRPRPPGRERTTDLPGVPTLRPLPEVTGARPQAEVDLGGTPARPPHPRSSLGAEAPLEEQGRALPAGTAAPLLPIPGQRIFPGGCDNDKNNSPSPSSRNSGKNSRRRLWGRRKTQGRALRGFNLGPNPQPAATATGHAPAHSGVRGGRAPRGAPGVSPHARLPRLRQGPGRHLVPTDGEGVDQVRGCLRPRILWDGVGRSPASANHLITGGRGGRPAAWRKEAP